MIVISPSVVLSSGGGVNANNPVVGWHNLVTIGNLAASGSAAAYPVLNLANPSTAQAQSWRGSNTAEQYLTVTVGTDEFIDYLAVARHNFGSGAVVVSVEGMAVEGGSWAELASEILPADDSPLLFRFVPQALFQIRLRMQPGAVIPRAAVLYVGKLLVLQRRIYVGHTPIPFGRESRITTGISESGDFLGRIVLGESLETSVDLQNMTPSWYRAQMDPFIVASKEVPFFFAWRPASYPRETGFAWMTNNPKPSNQRSNGMMQISLSMGGVSL
ncbi:hypothetical protein [Kaistia defluvii]|uniref:F5/8 type C domain-containing protein n=1 Tax=Kaistia defluvii TaxID=410841 RepID=A0ABV2R1N6_9HYPH